MRVPKVLTPSARADEQEAPDVVRRRRIVVALTLVVGATVLAQTLAASPGSKRFYGFALAAAATWLVGSLVAGPLPSGRTLVAADQPRDLAGPVALGVAAFGFFVVASLVARQIPGLDHALRSVLHKADAGPRPVLIAVAVINGVGEEFFFRGALHTALNRYRPELLATVVYALVTVVTGNVALVVAAVVMGTVFTLERRATRGILAPILTHITWSILMIVAFPR
ncbi:MAG: protease family protein [Actinomycetota bacterium]|jgi:membrane protease YdiL (CAAX protease family)